MNIEKVSLGFVVALMLGTALATPPVDAAQPEPIVTHDSGAGPEADGETFIMFDRDSTPEAPKCLQVQRWVVSIQTPADEHGNTQGFPLVRQVSRNSECTPDARPYENSWKATARQVKSHQSTAQAK